MASKPKDRGRWGGRRGVVEDRRRRKEIHRAKEGERGHGKGRATLGTKATQRR